MDLKEDPRGGCDIYACPSCGWEIDEMEYEYESGDPMELVQDERGDDYLIFRDDMPPAGCRACGGPYPYCRASCKMFDDYALSTRRRSPDRDSFFYICFGRRNGRVYYEKLF